ncbi:hypothetical protein [Nocardia sp. NPDC051570]
MVGVVERMTAEFNGPTTRLSWATRDVVAIPVSAPHGDNIVSVAVSR